MAAAKIIGAVAGSFVIAYVCDTAVSDMKIFGGTTPSTVSNKQWALETEKRLDAWPRVAGPPVIIDPINRQSFLIKTPQL